MITFSRLLNPMRGYFAAAEGSGAGGRRDDRDDPGKSSNSSARDGQSDRKDSNDGRFDPSDSAPTADSIESDIDSFGESDDTYGFDPQADNQFSVSAETNKFDGFGDDYKDHGFKTTVQETETFSEGFSRGIGDTEGQFSSGFQERPEDIRSFTEKVSDFFEYDIPNFFEEFQAAPLDTLTDVLTNPFVATVSAVTGFGAATAAVSAIDAAVDYFQGEQNLVDAAKQAASATIAGPAGAALGPAQGVAAEIAKSPTEVGSAVGGFLGGQAGGMTGAAVGGALAGNPYGAIAGGAIGSVAGAQGARELASRGETTNQEASASRTGDRKDRSSPLVEGPTKAPEAPKASAIALAQNVDIQRFNVQQQQPFNPYVGEIYRA